MKYRGKARKAALKIIFWTLVGVLALSLFGVLAVAVGSMLIAAGSTLIAFWIIFALFTLFFFRDPNPRVPSGPNLVISPAHGKVDIIDQVTESQFMEGPCHRISIFLSVFNVHVQNAPIAGRVGWLKHTTGQFMSALKTDSAAHNENVLIGFESAESSGEKIGMRLIAGVLARRIVPFVQLGEEVDRGARVSLIQFGSRCDLYLPLHYKVQVKIGDKVVGGETVMASKS